MAYIIIYTVILCHPFNHYFSFHLWLLLFFFAHRSLSLFLSHPHSLPLGLIHRAILLSGSALSPWSIIPDPDSIREEVSQQMACHLDTNGNNRLTKDITNDITNCLRSKPLAAIMGVRLPNVR